QRNRHDDRYQAEQPLARRAMATLEFAQTLVQIVRFKLACHLDHQRDPQPCAGFHNERTQRRMSRRISADRFKGTVLSGADDERYGSIIPLSSRRFGRTKPICRSGPPELPLYPQPEQTRLTAAAPSPMWPRGGREPAHESAQ